MINFRNTYGWSTQTDAEELQRHYDNLITYKDVIDLCPLRMPPSKYENHYCIDTMGKHLVWINENFPKEKYVWYRWFESVFIVPEDMYAILLLKYN